MFSKSSVIALALATAFSANADLAGAIQSAAKENPNQVLDSVINNADTLCHDELRHTSYDESWINTGGPPPPLQLGTVPFLHVDTDQCSDGQSESRTPKYVEENLVETYIYNNHYQNSRLDQWHSKDDMSYNKWGVCGGHRCVGTHDIFTGTQQLWRLIKYTSTVETLTKDYYMIKNVHTGDYLRDGPDSSGFGMYDGTKPLSNQDYLAWEFKFIPDLGVYFIVSKRSGRKLQKTGGNHGDLHTEPYVQYDFGQSQEWKLITRLWCSDVQRELVWHYANCDDTPHLATKKETVGITRTTTKSSEITNSLQYSMEFSQEEGLSAALKVTETEKLQMSQTITNNYSTTQTENWSTELTTNFRCEGKHYCEYSLLTTKLTGDVKHGDGFRVASDSGADKQISVPCRIGEVDDPCGC